MVTNDWFDSPNTTSQKPQKGGLLRYIWASICSGTGSGLFVGLAIVIFDALARMFGKPMSTPALDFGLEASAIAMVFFACGAFGFVVGSPIAFVFGGAMLKITQGIAQNRRAIVRYIIGFVIAVLMMHAINFTIDAKPPLFLEPMQYFMALLGGASAVWIFEHFSSEVNPEKSQ